jgi:hypothetical protein
LAVQAIEPLSACANESWRAQSYVSARRRSRRGSGATSRWTDSEAGKAGPAAATVMVVELTRGEFETGFEIEFVGGGCSNRILLVADDVIIVVIVVVVGGVGHNGLVLQNASHGASDGGWTATSMSGVESAAKLFMRVGDLGLELRVALCEALSDNVIDKTVAVFQFVPGLVAAEAKGRGVLVLGDGSNHEVDLLIIKGCLCR